MDKNIILVINKVNNNNFGYLILDHFDLDYK